MSLSRNIATLLTTEKISTSSVVELLTKYKMVSLLPSIRQALIQVSSNQTKNETIMIESPFPLSEESLQKIKHLVGDTSVEHQVIINKTILAGFKARFRGTLYDGSAERIIKQVLH